MKRCLVICVIIVLLINIFSPIIFAINELNNETEETVSKQIEEKINKNNEEIIDKQIEEQKTDIKNEENENQKKINNQSKNAQNTGKIRIDFPANGEEIKTAEMTIIGWAMSTDIGSQIKIYIDGNLKTAQIQREKRPDVIAGVLGYGGEVQNPNPGFSAKVSTKDLSTGNHIIKVELIDSKGNVLNTYNRQIYISSSATGKIRIDFPANGEKVEGTTMEIEGWAMSTDSAAQIKVYIDGNLKIAQIEREKRPDVIATVLGYGGEAQNPNPGFKAKISTKDVSIGNHNIKVELIDTRGNLLHSYERQVYIDNSAKGKIRIDFPASGEKVEGTIMEIEGWAMSTDSAAQIKVYIDGNLKVAQIEREKRPDVIATVSGYGKEAQNPNPGFKAKVSTKDISIGNHIIKVELIDSKNNILHVYERQIYIDNSAKGKIRIDFPSSSDKIKGTIMEIEGWAMSTDDIQQIRVYIDGNLKVAQIEREKRPDVIAAVSGYGGEQTNPNPGFRAKINIKDINTGNHTIKVELIDSKGNLLNTYERQVYIDNQIDAKIHIDTPKIMFEGDNLLIEGWVMCTDAKAQMKVYIDGTQKQVQIIRKQRPDVIEQVTGYGGQVTNPNPGFSTTVDISKYEKGKTHNIEIKLYSEEGSIVQTRKTDIIFYSDDKGNLHLEAPVRTMLSGNTATFVGWEMSELKDSVIKLYVDGREKKSLKLKRSQRQDVIDATSDKYGGIDVNPTPGFEATFSIENESQGIHYVKLELYSKEGKLLDSEVKKISIIKNQFFGVDVSAWQKEINWSNAKADGVNYAIIRVGWVGDVSNKKDDFFEANYRSCVNNGIPVGIYVYSYSTSVESARAEANKVIEWLHSVGAYSLRLPVFWDTEDPCQSGIDRGTLTAMADTFCSTIKNAGYNAGIYASKNWLTKNLDMSQLEDKYDVWVAQYNSECTYNGRYDIWQFSSSGSVSGIKGGVDSNWFYKKY